MLVFNVILIIIVHRPVFTKHPVAATVNISLNVMFSCTARGYDITNVTWMKVGSSRLPLTAMTELSFKRSRSRVTSILTITNTAGYYSGKYYCMATNKAGQTYSNQADLLVQGCYIAHIYIYSCVFIYIRTLLLILCILNVWLASNLAM